LVICVFTTETASINCFVNKLLVDFFMTEEDFLFQNNIYLILEFEIYITNKFPEEVEIDFNSCIPCKLGFSVCSSV